MDPLTDGDCTLPRLEAEHCDPAAREPFIAALSSTDRP
jgi:hypothetical protein